jgi:hypothetical protein
MKIVQMAQYKVLRCDDEPQGDRCTARLAEGACPSTNGECASSKFDAQKHNKDLPKFYYAQH